MVGSKHDKLDSAHKYEREIKRLRGDIGNLTAAVNDLTKIISAQNTSAQPAPDVAKAHLHQQERSAVNAESREDTGSEEKPVATDEESGKEQKEDQKPGNDSEKKDSEPEPFEMPEFLKKLDLMKKLDLKKIDKTSIILGLIILVLVGSIFYDFFGGQSQPVTSSRPQDRPDANPCKLPVPGLAAYDIFESADKEYINATIENHGRKALEITQFKFAKWDQGETYREKADIILQPGEKKNISITVIPYEHHKVDLMTDSPCGETTIWHEGPIETRFP